MRSSAALCALSSLALVSGQVTTGQLGDAVRILNDPQGAAYQARIVPGRYGSISASIVAVSAGDKGTEFAVNFAGLPATGGPFRKSSTSFPRDMHTDIPTVYHIHVDPIPTDGNCTSALGHLDPYIRGEMPACTSDRPETCQVGDLAGKHGTINGTSAMRRYATKIHHLCPTKR
jgi:hypothetical protein